MDQADHLKQLIDQERDGLLGELDLQELDRVRKLCNVEKLRLQTTIIDSFRQYVEKLLCKGTACEIAQQIGKLHNRCEELLKPDASLQILNDVVTGLTFVPAPCAINSTFTGKLDLIKAAANSSGW